MFDLVAIRFRQFWRAILRLGLFRTLVLLCLLCWLAAFSLHFAASNPMELAIMCMVLVLFIHTRRADLGFIRTHLPLPSLKIATEYAILLLPFALIVAPHCAWAAAAMLLGAAAMGWMPIPQTTPKRARHAKLLNHVPAHSFEWIAGLRTFLWPMLCLLIGGIALAWLPYISIVMAMGAALCVVNFYQTQEPRGMIEALGLAPAHFLRLKMLWPVGMLSILLLPVLGAYAAWHPAEWYIALYFLLNAMLSVMCAVVLKYGFNGHILLNAILNLNVLLPIILIPFVMFVLMYGLKKSLSKLKPILDDYNT